MNYKIEASSYFEHELKRLAKHYPSFKNDYRQFLISLKENPWQGIDLGRNIRKIRLLLLYDKKDADNFDERALEEAIREL